MDTKWSVWKKIVSFGCFFLGVSLLLFVLYWGAYTGYTRGFEGIEDPFRMDYQQTGAFRSEIARIFNAMLEQGNQEDGAIFEELQNQQNLVYLVVKDGVYHYSNEHLTGSARFGYLQFGYSWSLYYNGSKLEMMKTGAYSNVKGLSNPGAWDLPGLGMPSLGESGKGVRIYLAAATEPVQTAQDDPIYSVYSNAFWCSQTVLVLASLAAGLLLVMAWRWRQVLEEVLWSLSGLTKLFWIEGKAAVYLALLLFLIPSFGILQNTFVYGWQAHTNQTNYLIPFFTLWVFLLALNDVCRNGKGAFQNSLVWRIRVSLNTMFLKLPMEKRIYRRELFRLAALAVYLLLGFLLSAALIKTAGVWVVDYTPLALAALLLALALLWDQVGVVRRCRSRQADLLALMNQIEEIHGGNLSSPVQVPEGSDLRRAAEELSEIQGGLEKALIERTKSERMKVELIANVSHDLKTPLTSILSYGALLAQEEGLPDHMQDYIRILNQKAERLNIMVRDVFEVSKAASGDLSLKLEPLDLAKLIRQTLADMAEAVEGSGLTFKVDLQEPAPVLADGDRLYRVFQNLFGNALKYALRGSRVYVRLQREEGQAVAQVKNTSQEELPQSMDFTARFARGDQSRTDGGSGLGLAIASSFTQACGGSFTVHTDADLFTAEVAFPLTGQPVS